MIKISPSHAGIWGKPDGCRAYPSMVSRYPRTDDNEAAKDGIESHAIARKMIDAARTASPEPDFSDHDEELVDAARIYARDVIGVMRECNIFGSDALKVESRLSVDRIYPGMTGFCDAAIWDKNSGTLYLWDYKYGFKFVDVFENRQLICYANALTSDMNGLDDQHIAVVMRVVQPRCYNRDGIIREWRVKLSDLRPYFNELENHAHECAKPDAVARSGSHCYRCPGRHDCPAALNAGMNYLEAAEEPVMSTISNQALGAQLALVTRAIDQLSYLKTGYESQIEHRIKNGENVPGWTLEHKRSNLKWTKPYAEIAALGKMFGVEVEKRNLITPTQAISNGLPEKIVESYAGRESAGLKLKPVNLNKIKRILS